MLIIGILCLVVAVISYFKFISEKNNTTQDKEKSQNEAKWQKGLAILFLVLAIILVAYSIYLRSF